MRLHTFRSTTQERRPNMAIGEAERFEMHLAFKNTLGDAVANTVMEHLPPSGWGDVARERDVVRLERKLNLMIASTLTGALALIAIQVQILLSISNL